MPNEQTERLSPAGILRGMPCSCAHRYKCNHCGEWQPDNHPFCGRCELPCSLQTQNKCPRCQALALAEEQERELAELRVLLNTPETELFDKAVPLESAHQVQRWGAEHDAGKTPPDWFWLVGYLAGKALASHIAGNLDKAKHHCISTAAALRNWHAQIRSGESVMRPGISGEKQEAADGSRI